MQSKINIVWNVKTGPYGGGNQFLSRLKDQFVSMGLYAEEQDADIFLFNSHHEVTRVRQLRQLYPNKIFVHRVDGPMRLYNKKSDTRDDIVVDINKCADAVVFQSTWSQQFNLKTYPALLHKPNVVVHNGCDIEREKREKRERSDKIRLVAASISDNINKGYDIYSYLDKSLDFSRYDFTFIGRSPVQWKNIKDVGVKTPSEVIDIFVNSDIFITASKNDPCSNSLIEALAVGLPSLGLESGGHPELILNGGLTFKGRDDVLEQIDVLCGHLDYYSKSIRVDSMKDVANKYLAFFMEMKDGKYRSDSN